MVDRCQSSRWYGRREWAHRPEDAADAVQDGEGLLEALHDAQPDQDVLRMPHRALTGKPQLDFMCHQVIQGVPTVSHRQLQDKEEQARELLVLISLFVP